MKIKKFLAVVLAVFIGLVGCKNNATNISIVENSWENGSDTEQIVSAEKQTDWLTTHESLPVLFDSAVFCDDSIYGYYQDENNVIIQQYNFSDLELESEAKIGDVDEVFSISANKEGKVYIFGKQSECNSIWEVNSNGEVKKYVDFSVDNLGEFPEIRGFFCDNEGFSYLWYQMSVPSLEVTDQGEENVNALIDRVYILDRDMKVLGYDEVLDCYGESFINIIIDNDGKPVFFASDEEGYYERRINSPTGEKYEKKRIDMEVSIFSNMFNNSVSSDDGFFYTRDGDLHKFDYEKKTDLILFHLSSAGLFEEEIINLRVMDDTIEIIDNYHGLSNTEITRIQKGESNKNIITLAAMNLSAEDNEIIAEYNRKGNIEIKPVIYSDGNNLIDGYDRLKLDIVQGEAPDLFFTDGIDYEILAKSGALENLYDYMDKDSELGRKDIAQSLMSAYEEEGKLYTLAPSFNIFTMWGGKSVVKGRQGINLFELEEILSENGKDISAIFGLGGSDETPLRSLTAMELDSFINWEESTCDFKGEGFKHLLELSKEYKGPAIQSGIYSSIQNRDILFTMSIVDSVEDVAMQSKFYGEEVEFIGYPTDYGYGSAISAIKSVAMNSQSDNKEAAWDFIKYYVKSYDSTKAVRFPSYKPNFDDYIKKSTIEEYFEEDGNKIPIYKDSYSEPNVGSFGITKASDEDVKKTLELIENTTKKREYVTEIQNIIEEEAEPYMQGQKTFEQVSEIIQSRVQVFLNEKSK